jgi:hypothetical protein
MATRFGPKNPLLSQAGVVFLTEPEKAKQLKIHPETLAKLRRQGNAPAEYVLIGKSIRYVQQPPPR